MENWELDGKVVRVAFYKGRECSVKILVFRYKKIKFKNWFN